MYLKEQKIYIFGAMVGDFKWRENKVLTAYLAWIIESVSWGKRIYEDRGFDQLSNIWGKNEIQGVSKTLHDQQSTVHTSFGVSHRTRRREALYVKQKHFIFWNTLYLKVWWKLIWLVSLSALSSFARSVPSFSDIDLW